MTTDKDKQESNINVDIEKTDFEKIEVTKTKGTYRRSTKI
jgi:hypothetical protein